MLNKTIAQDTKLFDIPILVYKMMDKSYEIRVLHGGLWIRIHKISKEEYDNYCKNTEYITTP